VRPRLQMPNSPRDTQHASERCTDSSQPTFHDTEGQKIVTDFLRAELDLAFTMLSIAMETGRDADRKTFLSVAPNSIDSVRSLEGNIADSGDRSWIRARVRLLESAVRRIKSIVKQMPRELSRAASMARSSDHAVLRSRSCQLTGSPRYS